MFDNIKHKTAVYIGGTFHALKNRNFRYFWTGQCVSLIGTFMQNTAQTWLVYTLTKSPLLLGIRGACQFAPMLLFSLFIGPLIDRFSKKKILIITQSLFMFQAAALTVLTLTGLIQYWHILALSALYGITQTVDMPARQTFIFELVGKEDIMNAVSLNSTIINIAKIAGPAIAAVLILSVGIGYCFLINALSYVAVIAGITMIKYVKPVLQRMKKSIFREAADGLRYIVKSKILLINALIFFVVSTFALNNDVIIPVFSNNVLKSGADVYSGLLIAAGIGSLIGALFMASRSRYGLRNCLLIYGGLGTALLQVLTILTSSFYISLLIIAAIGFLNLVFLNTVNSIFQLNSSNEYRSRVMSIYSLLMQGTTPLGNLFAGAVMDWVPGDSGFVACGSITLILIVPVFMILRKSIKNLIFNKSAT